MNLGDLIRLFLDELAPLMQGWRLVKGHRSFHRTQGGVRTSFHIACVKHAQDFDAVGDVAVEILEGKKRVCIVGAELGNLAGTGQRRFPVSSAGEAKRSAVAMAQLFQDVGEPFIERFSDPKAILEVLRAGGREAILISPIPGQHTTQMQSLEAHIGL